MKRQDTGPAKKFFHKRSFGQNFLTNSFVKKKILDQCRFSSEETVLEIGPGDGALTKGIAQRVKKLIAVEKDITLASALEKRFDGTNVAIIQSDILKYPFDQLPSPLKVVGNLPYNIATVIIEKVLNNRRQCHELYMTVQIEHGRRMTAAPGSRDYGSFSCFVQYYSRPKILFRIKNTSFYPVPKVESCFMHLDILEEPKLKPRNEEFLFKVIRGAFGQRRKTIANALSRSFEKGKTEAVLRKIGMEPNLRAENIALEDFIKISDLLWEKTEEEVI